MTALINGIIGTALTLVLALNRLGMSAAETIHCLIASIVAGLIAVLVTLTGEQIGWVKRKILTRSLTTWIVFAGLYFVSLYLLAPPIRDWHRFWILILPLILSTGFTILIFGPIQDKIVARRQKRNRNTA